MIVEDAIAHCDDAGGDSEVGEAIRWYTVGKSPSSGVALKIPNIGLDSKAIRGYGDACVSLMAAPFFGLKWAVPSLG